MDGWIGQDTVLAKYSLDEIHGLPTRRLDGVSAG